ncbi:Alanyl-tRNA editing protein AlaX-M [uncultured archaeon]|nr:Alanyl-tRNA editing protein AlaX-M [uncultured archaeon]
MTRRLYWQDAYLKEFDSEAERAEANRIVLRETAFYPTGGGAPHDTGVLTLNGTEVKVVDVIKEGEDIIHVLDSAVEISSGDRVHGAIDWNRRYSIMRYHTALHLLDAIVERGHPNCRITGGQIFVDRARMDLDFPELNRELLQKIIDETNGAALEGHAVFSKEITRAEALKMPNLARTEPGRLMIMGMDTVRLIEIEGLDVQMDGGVHVANTREIGRILFNAYENKGSHRKRVDVVLEN